jgi:hypothetical protein
MRASTLIALFLFFSAGCSGTRRVALHVDPVRAYDAALAQHGGYATIPSSTSAAALVGPVLVLPFADRTIAPTGSYLDDRDPTPVSEVYLVPDVAAHLYDHVVDVLHEGGARAYRAYDDASAREAAPSARMLELELITFELHRWMKSEPVPGAPAGVVDIVHVVYRYRWRNGDGSSTEPRKVGHRLLLPKNADALDVAGRYIVREIAAGGHTT